MKHFVLWLAFCVFALALSGCKTQSPSPENALSIENPYIDCVYNNINYADKSQQTPTFDVLYELTTDIVIGYLADDRRQDLQVIDGTNIVVFGCNISTLKITRVYKGSLKKGDEIPFAEKYYFDEEDEAAIYAYEGYRPSVPGQEYIFFMSAAKEGMFAGIYTPNDYNLGRYPYVSSSEMASMNAEELTQTYNIKLDVGQEKYTEFFKAAVKKYGK